MSIKKSDRFGWGPRCRIPLSRLQFLVTLAQGRNILDIGCGPGHFLKYLAQNSFTAIGVDKYQYSKKIIKAPATKLPFSNNSFDTAFLNNILEHNRHDQQILIEALRVAPRVVITVPQRCPSNLSGRGVVYQHYQDRSHLRTYTVSSLKKLVSNSNGKILKIIPTELLPNRELFSELISGPLFWRKLISRVIFYLIRPKHYYLELVAVIKRK